MTFGVELVEAREQMVGEGEVGEEAVVCRDSVWYRTGEPPGSGPDHLENVVTHQNISAKIQDCKPMVAGTPPKRQPC